METEKELTVPEPAFQEKRDLEFSLRVDKWKKTFHEKNVINADAYMSMNETLHEAFEDIDRKYNRLKAQLKYSEVHINIASVRDNIMDLGVYSVMFDMFVEEYYTKFPEKKKSVVTGTSL